MLMLAHAEGDATLHPRALARTGLLTALDVDELWQACVAEVVARLPCHSCSLLYDIEDLHPRRGLHHVVADTVQPIRPATSLAVAAPFLQRHPRILAYTFSQIALDDRQACARVLAQDPAPGWRDFIHMAFWHEDGLDAVLSIRLSSACPAPGADDLDFLLELHPLVDAALQRIRRLRAERRRQRALEARLLGDAGQSRLAAGVGRIAATGQRQRRRTATGSDAGTEPRAFACERDATDSALLQRLSPSERRVAAMVGSGMRNAAIAAQLCRSPKTIENQISAIYRKLDIENRAQLARLLA